MSHSKLFRIIPITTTKQPKKNMKTNPKNYFSNKMSRETPFEIIQTTTVKMTVPNNKLS